MQVSIVGIKWDLILEPRKLFEVHRDFPMKNVPIDWNLDKLEKGSSVTTNGVVFVLCQDILTRFYDIIRHLNKYEDVKIPSNPNNLNLQTRILKEGVRIYIKCQSFSDLKRLVGEPIKGISINKDRIMDV